MTLTIDRIKELVPEATVSHGGALFRIGNGVHLSPKEGTGLALLTTRAEVERLTATMKEIDKGFYSHKLTIREAQRMIRQALEKGE